MQTEIFSNPRRGIDLFGKEKNYVPETFWYYIWKMKKFHQKWLERNSSKKYGDQRRS